MPPGLTSPFHLAVIFVVALIVLGPERLPGVARGLGRAVREAQHWSERLSREVNDAMATVSEPPPPDNGPDRRDAIAADTQPMLPFVPPEGTP